jgi:hypothetical protein
VALSSVHENFYRQYTFPQYQNLHELLQMLLGESFGADVRPLTKRNGNSTFFQSLLLRYPLAKERLIKLGAPKNYVDQIVEGEEIFIFYTVRHCTQRPLPGTSRYSDYGCFYFVGIFPQV